MSRKRRTDEIGLQPSFVVRTGIAPVERVQAFRSPLIEETLDLLLSTERKSLVCREQMSLELFHAIGNEGDKRRRARLLAIRRELFRGQHEDWSFAEESAAFSSIGHCVSANRAVYAARTALQLEHSSAMVRGRDALLEFTRDEDFRKSLLLSSEALYSALARYATRDGAKLTAKDEQTERGLLRYFIRATMKATPFARFCAIGWGVFAEDSSARAYRFDRSPHRKQGHVRLNRSIYSRIWHLLKVAREIRDELVLDVNPTLERTPTCLRFVSHVGGREVVRKIAHNDSLDLCLKLTGRDRALCYREVVDLLVSHDEIETNHTEARQFLDGLLELGALRLRSLIPEQEADWDRPLSDALLTLGGPLASSSGRALRVVRALVDEYVEGTAAQRFEIQARLSSQLQSFLVEIGDKSGQPIRQPLYEDASTDAVAQLPLHRGFRLATRGVERWIALTESLCQVHSEQETMRRFFDESYGAMDSVGLLQFFEDYYRAHLKEQMRAEKESARPAKDNLGGAGAVALNPYGLESVRERTLANQRLASLFDRACESNRFAEEVRVSHEEVESCLNHGKPVRFHSRARSYSVFVQVVTDEEGIPERLVLRNGQYLVGFGKYLSRFLYLLPDQVTQDVQEHNEFLGGSDMLAELTDDAALNVDLHPRLLPFLMEYPTAEGGPVAGILKVRDVSVRRCGDGAVQLFDVASGRTITPIDVGFANPRLRPPFFRLVDRFSPCGGFSVRLRPSGSANAMAPSAPEYAAEAEPIVTYRPRIVFDETIVLSRRRWTVASIHLPRLRSGAEFEFFEEVGRWRRVHGIPTQVYVRMFPTRDRDRHSGSDELEKEGARNAGGEGSSKITPIDPKNPALVAQAEGKPVVETPRNSRDWTKPQYIAFDSPVLVGLLGRMWGALSSFRLEIEESLPSESQLARFGTDSYATELVLQASFVSEGTQSRDLRT